MKKKILTGLAGLIIVIIGGSFVIQKFSESGENPIMTGVMHTYMWANDITVSQARHQLVHKGLIPAEYQNKVSPLAESGYEPETGKALYDQNCANCHGTTGVGDGPQGRGLDPVPSNLKFVIKQHISTDDYVYWTIADGGEPLKSAMPTFKAALSEDQIWQIIAYLRTL